MVKPRLAHRRGPAAGEPERQLWLHECSGTAWSGRTCAGEMGPLPASPPPGKLRPLRAGGAGVGPPPPDVRTPHLQPVGASAPSGTRAEAQGGWCGSSGAAQSPAREPATVRGHRHHPELPQQVGRGHSNKTKKAPLSP